MHHQARKRFGQHFLTDGGIIDAIVQAIAPASGQSMVEIGPGLAALTQPLVERLGRLTVIELDRDLALRLRLHPQLEVIESDVLRVDFAPLCAAAAEQGGLRIVGNLPYNISTPLLFYLTEYIAHVRDIHVMLQKEVVERMVAAPDTSAYGRLSVALQYRFEMEKVLDVGPDAFYPQPKVDSAVVRMLPRVKREPAATDEALFARIVTTAFSQRRKTLRNTLRNILELADFEVLNIDAGARAETLSVSDFVQIANWVTEQQKTF